MRSGRVTKIFLSLSPPLSKDEEVNDIGHSMSIGILILGVNSVTFSQFIDYQSLLQNATGNITKCDSYFSRKCDKSLSQNAPGFFVTKYDSSVTKKPRLLQITIVHSCFGNGKIPRNLSGRFFQYVIFQNKTVAQYTVNKQAFYYQKQ